jgi:transcriptional regulator of acetoin/glycerol metabolism
VLRLSACTAANGIITEADLDLPPCSDGATPGLKAAERHVIAEALGRHHGDVAETARTLHVSRATLYRKIKALKIAVTDH